MSDELKEAVLGESTPEELAGCRPPESTLALCLRREEESMFDGYAANDIDIRQSLHIDQVDLPDIAPDEVLIATMASAVNYNTVWSAMFRPISTFRFLEQLDRQEPDGSGPRHAIDRHILGTDGAGVLVRVGSNVRHWKVGDHVTVHSVYPDVQEPVTHSDGMLSENQRVWGYETNFGAFAHYSIAKGIQLLPKPSFLTWEEAACSCGCLATAYRMLIGPNGSRVKLGDLVLVWGATGGLGAYAVQLAKAAGCQVVAIVSSPQKERLADALDCDLVVNRATLEGFDDSDDPWPLAACRSLRSQIRSHFGRDPDHVLEHVGQQTFGASVFLAARGGTVVTCGSSTGYEHVYDNRLLWTKVKRIIGSHSANYAEAWAAMRLIDNGFVTPVLSDVYPLDQVPLAARAVQQGRHLGKLGVLCLAPTEGSGVTDPELRAKSVKPKLDLFRTFSQPRYVDAASSPPAPTKSGV
jgi:crotonyl-CoA reductase